MRIAIVGSRHWPNYALAENAVRRFVASLPLGTVVISGAASGVDSWAASEAIYHGLQVVEIPVPKVRYATKADFAIAAKNRNTKIIAAADEVVAFWNGESGGTLDSINKAKRMGKPVRVLGQDGAS